MAKHSSPEVLGLICNLLRVDTDPSGCRRDCGDEFAVDFERDMKLDEEYDRREATLDVCHLDEFFLALTLQLGASGRMISGQEWRVGMGCVRSSSTADNLGAGNGFCGERIIEGVPETTFLSLTRSTSLELESKRDCLSLGFAYP